MNKIMQGLAGVLLPLGLYGATPQSSYGSYYRPNVRVSASKLGTTSKMAKLEAFRALELPADLQSLTQSHDTISIGDELTLHAPQRELLIIDAAVPDKHLFMRDLRPGVDIAIIESDSDGLDQLEQILSQYKDISTLHLVSHAADGVLQLGDTEVTNELLQNRLYTLAMLDNALVDGGDLLLYGCDLGATEKGQDLLELISGKAHVDIAASDDLSGNLEQGGDWDLEIVLGDVESQVPFSEKALQEFSSILQTTVETKFLGMATGGYKGVNGTYVGIATSPLQVSETFNTDAGNQYMYWNAPDTSPDMYFKADGANACKFTVSEINAYSLQGGGISLTAGSSVEFTIDGGGTVTRNFTGSLPDAGSVDLFTLFTPTTAVADVTSFKISLQHGAAAIQDVAFLSIELDSTTAPGGCGGGNTAPSISIDNSNLNYTAGDAVTQIDSAATVNDADGDADWNTGTLTVQITGNPEAADEISIPDNIVNTINTDGFNLRNGATVFGTLSASEGTVTNNTTLTVTFNGNATNSLVQDTARAIHYRNTSGTPSVLDRTVTFTATDDDAGSNADTRTIAVAPGGGGNTVPSAISLTPSSIETGATGANKVVGTLSQTDPDADVWTFSLVPAGTATDAGGCTADTDNGSFNISGTDFRTSGALAIGAYEVCVRVSDGTATFRDTMAISVNANTAEEDFDQTLADILKTNGGGQSCPANASDTGDTDADGDPVCECDSGFQFNSEQTACEAIPGKPQELIISPSSLTLVEGQLGEITVSLAADIAEGSAAITLSNVSSELSITGPRSGTLRSSEDEFKVSFDVVDNSVIEGPRPVDMRINAAIDGSPVQEFSELAVVTIEDNDVAGFVVDESSLKTLIEGSVDNSETSITIALASQPTAGVILTVKDDSGRVSANPESFSISISEWDQPRTVTLTANNDSEALGSGTVTLAITEVGSTFGGLTDLNYAGIATSVDVNLVDDDSKQFGTLTVSADNLQVAAESTVTIVPNFTSDVNGITQAIITLPNTYGLGSLQAGSLVTVTLVNGEVTQDLFFTVGEGNTLSLKTEDPLSIPAGTSNLALTIPELTNPSVSGPAGLFNIKFFNAGGLLIADGSSGEDALTIAASPKITSMQFSGSDGGQIATDSKPILLDVFLTGIEDPSTDTDQFTAAIAGGGPLNIAEVELISASTQAREGETHYRLSLLASSSGSNYFAPASVPIELTFTEGDAPSLSTSLTLPEGSAIVLNPPKTFRILSVAIDVDASQNEYGAVGDEEFNNLPAGTVLNFPANTIPSSNNSLPELLVGSYSATTIFGLFDAAGNQITDWPFDEKVSLAQIYEDRTFDVVTTSGDSQFRDVVLDSNFLDVDFPSGRATFIWKATEDTVVDLGVEYLSLSVESGLISAYSSDEFQGEEFEEVLIPIRDSDDSFKIDISTDRTEPYFIGSDEIEIFAALDRQVDEAFSIPLSVLDESGNVLEIGDFSLTVPAFATTHGQKFPLPENAGLAAGNYTIKIGESISPTADKSPRGALPVFSDGSQLSVSVSLVQRPMISLATYDLTTQELIITGESFVETEGANNDISFSSVSAFRIFAGEDDEYAITQSDPVDIASDTSFTILVSDEDHDALVNVVNILTNVGTENESGTYSLAVQAGWMPGGGDQANIPLTVIQSIPTPEITNVTIPNEPTVPGETVTATLTILPESADFSGLELSGTIGGFEVSNFQRIEGSTYTAEFSIPALGNGAETGNDSSGIPVTFEVTETDGVVEFSGTATGNITVSWSGEVGKSVATFTRGGIEATETPDFDPLAGGEAKQIILAAGQVLQLSSADADLLLSNVIDGVDGDGEILRIPADIPANDSIEVSLTLSDTDGAVQATYKEDDDGKKVIVQDNDAILTTPAVINLTVDSSVLDGVEEGSSFTITATASDAFSEPWSKDLAIPISYGGDAVASPASANDLASDLKDYVDGQVVSNGDVIGDQPWDLKVDDVVKVSGSIWDGTDADGNQIDSADFSDDYSFTASQTGTYYMSVVWRNVETEQRIDIIYPDSGEFETLFDSGLTPEELPVLAAIEATAGKTYDIGISNSFGEMKYSFVITPPDAEFTGPKSAEIPANEGSAKLEVAIANDNFNESGLDGKGEVLTVSVDSANLGATAKAGAQSSVDVRIIDVPLPEILSVALAEPPSGAYLPGDTVTATVRVAANDEDFSENGSLSGTIAGLEINSSSFEQVVELEAATDLYRATFSVTRSESNTVNGNPIEVAEVKLISTNDVTTLANTTPNNLNGSGLTDGVHSTALNQQFVFNADRELVLAKDIEPILEFTFSEPTSLDGLRIWNSRYERDIAGTNIFTDWGIKELDAVFILADGQEFEQSYELLEASDNNGAVLAIPSAVSGQSVSRVQLIPRSNHGGRNFGLAEVQFLSNPSSANGGSSAVVATDFPAGNDIPVNLTLTNGDGVSSLAFTTPISQDNDAIYRTPVQIEFDSQVQLSVNEGGSRDLNFKFTPSGVIGTRSSNVPLSYGGTATPAMDYTQASRLNFFGESLSVEVTIDVNSDTESGEGVETIVVSIDGSQLPSYLQVGDRDSITISISDLPDDQSTSVVSRTDISDLFAKVGGGLSSVNTSFKNSLTLSKWEAPIFVANPANALFISESTEVSAFTAQPLSQDSESGDITGSVDSEASTSLVCAGSSELRGEVCIDTDSMARILSTNPTGANDANGAFWYLTPEAVLVSNVAEDSYFGTDDGLVLIDIGQQGEGRRMAYTIGTLDLSMVESTGVTVNDSGIFIDASGADAGLDTVALNGLATVDFGEASQVNPIAVTDGSAFAEDGVYYVVAVNPVTFLVDNASDTGLSLDTASTNPSMGSAYITYEDGEGGKRRQELVRWPRFWNVFQATLEQTEGVTRARIDSTGLITVNANDAEVKAVADYLVQGSDIPIGFSDAAAGVFFDFAGDRNGDGIMDYTLFWPNGDRQTLYILTP